MKPTKDYILTYYSNTLMDMVRAADFNQQMALPVSFLLQMFWLTVTPSGTVKTVTVTSCFHTVSLYPDTIYY